MTSEQVFALQSYYIPKYADLFAAIADMGGMIFRQQLCRLLYNNQEDSACMSRLIDKLLEAQLFREEFVGRNMVLTLTYPVMRYLDIQRTVRLSNARIKLAALVLEKYLRQGIYKEEYPALALRNKLKKSSFRKFQPHGFGHMEQLQRIIKVFQEKGYKTDGLKYQYERMEKRFTYCCRKEYNSEYKLNLTSEADFYTLECKNIYLLGIREITNEYGTVKPQAIIEVYLVSDWNAQRLAKNIIEAKRTIESTIQNDCDSIIRIYSHEKESIEYMNKVYKHLETYPEFSLAEMARNEVSFFYFDTKNTLFSGIEPSLLR